MRRARRDARGTVQRGLPSMANRWGWGWKYPSERYRFVPLATCQYRERFGPSIPHATVYAHRFDNYSSAADVHGFEPQRRWVV